VAQKPQKPYRGEIDLLQWVVTITLLVGLAFAIYFLLLADTLRFWHTRDEAVRRLGSLDPASFARGRPRPEENAVPWLVAAGRPVDPHGLDWNALWKPAGMIHEGWPDVDWPRLAGLVARHRAALGVAHVALERTGCDIGIDYKEMSLRIPEGFAEGASWQALAAQGFLARLLFAEGLLALHRGDLPGTLAGARRLGRQAACFERQPLLPFQLLGAEVEGIQHQLLADLITRPDVTQAALAEVPGVLVGTDVRGQYREALRYSAASNEHFISSLLRGRGPLSRSLSSLALDRRRESYLRHLLIYLDAYGWPDERIKRELHDSPETAELKFPTGGRASDLWYAPVVLRTLAESRDLVRLAAGWRRATLASGDCRGALAPFAAEWRRRHGAGLEFEVARTGACTLSLRDRPGRRRTYAGVSEVDPPASFVIPAER
jgi:hypothetical protein